MTQAHASSPSKQARHYPPLLQRVDIQTVVVFRALQVGDMLCAVPALRALRAALPHAHIALAGLPWAAQFASRFPRYIDAFYIFPGHPALPEQPVQALALHSFYAGLRAQKKDLALQLHGDGCISNRIVAQFGAQQFAGFAASATECASSFFYPYPDAGNEAARLLALLRYLGAPQQNLEMEFPLTAADHDELRQSGLASGLSAKTYVCLHPGARDRAKCWPVESFAQIGDALAREYGVTIVLTGAAGERDLTTAVAVRMQEPAINAAGAISLGAMAALMKNSLLLICNDTGVSHVAAGLQLPSVVIFNASDMQRWAPSNRSLHRCVQDTDGRKMDLVLQHARELLFSEV